MWDVQKGNCVRLFTGHTRGVISLAVSSNGRLLASGGIFQKKFKIFHVIYFFRCIWGYKALGYRGG